MSDKTLELVEILYIEFKESFRKMDRRLENLEEGQKRAEVRFENLEEGQKKLEVRLGNLEEGQRKIEIKIENDINDKIRALFDDREVTKDSFNNINNTLSDISEKLDIHNMKIRLIEGGRSKKAKVKNI